MTVPSERGTGTPGGRLAQNVKLLTGTWSAKLALAPDDPYFFDHPLDHVPGMALISGLLDLVRATGAGHPERSGQQLTASFELPSFCELGPPTYLEVVQPPAGGKISVQAHQVGRVVCEGDLTFRQLAPSRPTYIGGHRSLAPPVDQALVQRHRQENVLVTNLAIGDTSCSATIRRPPLGHRLSAPHGRPLRVEALIDAARQFGTLISHLRHGGASETQFVLLGIQIDVPCGPRSDVHLRWTITPPPRGRSRMVFDVLTGDPDAEPCGTIGFDYFGASPTVYRRLRGAGRAA